MNIKSLITSLLAGLGYLLAVILVTQLLSGDFDTRTCTTECVQMLYWSAFAATALALIGGGVLLSQGQTDWCIKISIAASAVLMIVFLTTMAIGTFG